MKYILIPFLLTLNLYALSPFSLEGFKEANIKVLVKNKKLISKELKKKIQTDLEKELHKLGIKTKSDNFSNLLFKIEAIPVDEKIIVYISLFIVEDVKPSRDTNLESLGITYKKDDFFETTKEDFETELYESAIEFLLEDFKDQYKEENS